MYENESMFRKYVDNDYSINTKDKALFDKQIIKRCSTAFASIAILGIGYGIAHNRLEQQQIKKDLATVVTDADYSNLRNADYKNKKEIINKINGITSELSKIMTPIIEQNIRAENYLIHHKDDKFAVEEISETCNFDSDLNSKNMKRSYILTQEMKNIYNTVKDNPNYKDIKDSLFIKMTKIAGDYNIIIKSSSFEALFAPSSYFLKNTLIDTEKVSFDEWQNKLERKNIRPYGNDLKDFFEIGISENKKKDKTNIYSSKKSNVSDIGERNIMKEADVFIYDISKNISQISNELSEFNKSVHMNINEINDSIDDIKKEGKRFNNKVKECHHEFKNNYNNIEKNYFELERTINMIM